MTITGRCGICKLLSRGSSTGQRRIIATQRGLARDVVLSLGTGAWIRDRHNLLITGPTGIGKSWSASAFVQSACRHGFTATYLRAPRLLHELAVSRGDGSCARLLARLAKRDLLAIDDWLLAPLTDAERRDLLEVIEDRSERASTLKGETRVSREQPQFLVGWKKAEGSLVRVPRFVQSVQLGQEEPGVELVHSADRERLCVVGRVRRNGFKVDQSLLGGLVFPFRVRLGIYAT